MFKSTKTTFVQLIVVTATATAFAFAGCSKPGGPPDSTSGAGGGASGAGGTGAAAPSCRVGVDDTNGEFTGCSCLIPALPPYGSLVADALLPDPFLSMSGSRISALADWTCRRAEIKAQLENYELGAKPPMPAMVSGTVTSTSITVNA